MNITEQQALQWVAEQGAQVAAEFPGSSVFLSINNHKDTPVTLYSGAENAYGRTVAEAVRLLKNSLSPEARAASLQAQAARLQAEADQLLSATK